MLKTVPNTNLISHIWKLANIVPIPKPNKDIDNGTSYKPISLLSVIAKTLDKSNIANTLTQHGYKTQHRSKGVQRKGLTCANNHCSTRYEQSFDTINIHTLIRKLLQTNIPSTIIKFIANYIKGRKACTTYGNHMLIQN